MADESCFGFFFFFLSFWPISRNLLLGSVEFSTTGTKGLPPAPLTHTS